MALRPWPSDQVSHRIDILLSPFKIKRKHNKIGIIIILSTISQSFRMVFYLQKKLCRRKKKLIFWSRGPPRTWLSCKFSYRMLFKRIFLKTIFFETVTTITRKVFDESSWFLDWIFIEHASSSVWVNRCIFIFRTFITK